MSGGFQGPAESTARAPLTCSHLFIVYEHGRPKAAGRPLDQVCRLLRTHVDQHTLGYQERRQPGGERKQHVSLQQPGFQVSTCGNGRARQAQENRSATRTLRHGT